MGAKLNWTQDTCWMKSNDRFLRWGSALCRVKQVVSGVPTGLWVPPTFWPFLPSQWNPQRAEAMGWWSPGLVVQVASLPLIPWPHRPFLSICKGGGKVRVWPRPCLCLKPLPFLLSLLLLFLTQTIECFCIFLLNHLPEWPREVSALEV